MIKRRNILELIGKNRGKYHSCIITCYSLDFSFFEERVLPTLRLSNVKNVNILADGHYLEKAQEATTGKEFQHNKTYNFQPIYERGVFHPKIMLLTGVKHGLLIIGSGNITSAGLSTNDEIWGAFHLDNLENENVGIFGSVWDYLQPYLHQSYGFVPQKIDWMRKHSPWLEELPKSNGWNKFSQQNSEVKFVGNSLDSSMFSQLIKEISIVNTESITTISPYYDKTGAQLKQLREHFNPSKFNCIVDVDSGLIPSKLEKKDIEKFNFYNWNDCKKDFDDVFNRLHAKLIHIENSKEEFLLLGSANITLAALGKTESSSANSEAGILIKRPKQKQSFLEELSVQIPKQTITLKDKEPNVIGESSVKRSDYHYRVLYAEMRGDEITLFLNKDIKENHVVKTIDRSDLTEECDYVRHVENSVAVKTSSPENTFKVAIYNDNDRISNFFLVHRLESLLRCNPDPKQEKLDYLLEQEYSDGDGISDLLQFIDYNWADDSSANTNSKRGDKLSTHSKASDSDKRKEKFEVLSSEEFNKVSNESILKQSGELSHSTVKIAEFLNLYSSGVFQKEEDFSESEEQKLLEDKEQNGEGEDVEKHKKKTTQGSKEKRAIQGYLRRLDDSYSTVLSVFYKTGALTESPKNPVSVKLLSSILIAIHLIQIKNGKKFTVLTKDLDEEGDVITKEESYINHGLLSGNPTSIKGFLSNVLGKFLLLSSAGYKQYDYELVNNRIFKNRLNLLTNGLILILNTPWKISENIKKDILSLNLLHFTLGEELLKEDALENLLSSLQRGIDNSPFQIPEFISNFEYFKTNVLPRYIKWLTLFKDKETGRKKLIHSTSRLRNGDILFSSKIGFSKVSSITPSGDRYTAKLERPGFPFEDGEFTLKHLQLGNRCIIYS